MADIEGTSYTKGITDDDMRLTPTAMGKMGELLGDAEGDIEGIRIFVTGGGCSGMTYGMTYADTVSEYDSTLDCGGYTVYVDAVALNYLRGCEIDFAEGSFLFKNVFQAIGGSGACGGCGGSF